jgi:hypothetical protein
MRTLLASTTAFALLPLALVLAGGLPASAADQPATQVEGSDSQPILLVPPTKLTPDGDDLRLTFELPAGAAQGPATWYTLRTRLRFHWEKGAQTSASFVASTNDRVVSQVELQSTDAGRRLYYSSRTTGPTERITNEATSEVDFESYAQFGGVQPGINHLHIVLNNHRGRPVRAVETLPGTAIIRTDIHPYQLSLGTPEQRVTVEAGAPAQIPIRLKHRGERPESPVSLTAVSSGKGLRSSFATSRFPSVGTSTDASLVLDTDRTGSYTVLVTAQSEKDVTKGVVHVDVVATSRRETVSALAGAGLVGSCALLLVSRRLRRRVPQNPRAGQRA